MIHLKKLYDSFRVSLTSMGWRNLGCQVIQGLFPGRDSPIILDLLFDLATWHAYAKLRVHTEQTLTSFDAVRKFQRTTCMTYRTTELPQEHAARGRRTAALAAKQGLDIPTRHGSNPKTKSLNLSTYKYSLRIMNLETNTTRA